MTVTFSYATVKATALTRLEAISAPTDSVQHIREYLVANIPAETGAHEELAARGNSIAFWNAVHRAVTLLTDVLVVEDTAPAPVIKDRVLDLFYKCSGCTLTTFPEVYAYIREWYSNVGFICPFDTEDMRETNENWLMVEAMLVRLNKSLLNMNNRDYVRQEVLEIADTIPGLGYGAKQIREHILRMNRYSKAVKMDMAVNAQSTQFWVNALYWLCQ